MVGSYAANAWGLYDTHGSVCEWCLDGYDYSSLYPAGPVTDPCALGGVYNFFVQRGGTLSSPSEGCRSAYRSFSPWNWSGRGCGFRVVCAPVLP